jgi:hypothetical protein
VSVVKRGMRFNKKPQPVAGLRGFIGRLARVEAR